MIKSEIIKLINENSIISNMMLPTQIYGVLYYLDEILKNNIDGDIVELGCNVGTTSLYIRRLLNTYKNKKQYHVYDSWEGLPEKLDIDKGEKEIQFYEGNCKTSKESFEINFFTNNLTLPVIHSGWFKDIPDSEYPEKISFAFLDGDFYTSIIDSLNKIYKKMVPGGIIIIDDCGWNALPGCKKAVEDFLEDKPENLTVDGYPNDKLDFGDMHCGGKIIKI